MKRVLIGAGKLVALPAALALLAAVVAAVGPAAIAQRLLALRWILPLVLLAGFLKHALRATAWALAMRADGVRPRFREVLRARIGAQAFAYLSGTGLVVSESVRPLLLRRVAPAASILAASAVESGVYLFTSVLVTASGVAAIARLIGVSGIAWTLVSVGLVATFAFLLFATRPLLPRLERGIAALGWQRVAAALARAATREREIRSFRLRYPHHTLGVLALDLMVQAVMLAEVWLLLWAIGVMPGARELLVIEAGSRAIKMVGFSVPGRVGADEAGAAGVFALLGYDPAAGVTLALARRVQALAWSGIGLLWLAGGVTFRRVLGERGRPYTSQPIVPGESALSAAQMGRETS